MTTIGSLVEHLFARFPANDAAEWDNCGLAAGDPAAEVRGVHVALDPSAFTVAEAREAGANVLLTHHPAFLGTLDSVVADTSASGVVFEAVASGIALVAMHTNLDRAVHARSLLPGILGIEYVAPLEGAALGDDVVPAARYGQICTAPAGETVSSLASRAAAAFDVAPRVWGDPGRTVAVIATATGSAGSLVEDALAVEADVLVCGELRYHDALAAHAAGLVVIEVGHDVSEFCLLAPLTEAVLELDGVSPAMVTESTARPLWWTAT